MIKISVIKFLAIIIVKVAGLNLIVEAYKLYNIQVLLSRPIRSVSFEVPGNINCLIDAYQ